MSKKQTTNTCKFLRSDARCLSPEAIEEIRNAQNNIPDAQRIMCKKHRIGSTTYQKIIDNQRPPEPTEKWCRIIESIPDTKGIPGEHPAVVDQGGREDGIIHTKQVLPEPE